MPRTFRVPAALALFSLLALLGAIAWSRGEAIVLRAPAAGTGAIGEEAASEMPALERPSDPPGDDRQTGLAGVLLAQPAAPATSEAALREGPRLSGAPIEGVAAAERTPFERGTLVQGAGGGQGPNREPRAPSAAAPPAPNVPPHRQIALAPPPRGIATPPIAAAPAPARVVATPPAPTRAIATPPVAAVSSIPAERLRAPLPQSGVLASTFVSGRGAQARLEDLLDRGVLVGGEHVRLEAFDELGRLPYAVPAERAVALYAGLERSEIRREGERVHLQIALLARQGELPVRPRIDVRLVIDRSGSMGGEKWRHAIAAAHAVIDQLRPTDTFGLISYADDATLDLAPRRVGDRAAAHAAIDRLSIGGGTNIEGGLAIASANLPSRRRPSDVPLVVVLSDGVANVGQTAPDMIAARAREMFDANGVITTAIGVGTDFDEQTMLAIAREGSGSYHFVRRSEDIAPILADELEQRVQAVAQDLRLRIELAPGVVATRVYGSRLLDEREAAAVRATEVATDVRLARELGIARDRQRDEDRGLRMHFPTFRRGDQHVVLMELEVPPGTDPTEIARVSLDWKDLVREDNDHALVTVQAARATDEDRSIASTDRHVKRTVLAFQAGEALQETARALERGDVAGAELALSERIQLLRTASSLWRDAALDRDVRILEQYQRVLGSAWNGFDDGSRHTLVMAMNDYGDRRMQ